MMINNKFRYHNFIREACVDSMAYQMLNPILEDFHYLPYTASAIRPSAIVTILNDILINKRKNIIEFGCGISTLIMAKFAQLNQLGLSIYSIEENREWFELIASQLNKYNINERVNLVYSPVEEIENDNKWYNLEFLSKLPTIDCVIVDGPKAHEVGNEMIRSYALTAIKPRLADNHSIILDDCHRKGEHTILIEWAKKLQQQHNLYYQYLGVIFTGKHYNISL